MREQIDLEKLRKLAEDLIAADKKVEEANDELKRIKESARVIREETIPTAMQELGLKSIELLNGQKLTIAEDVYASIPKNNSQDAFCWLENNGHGGLIKVNVSIEYGKNQRDDAVGLFNELYGRGLKANLSQNIHPSTLKAFIKEQLKEANPFPLDLFGASPVFKAKITG